jgi:hypothetical protein
MGDIAEDAILDDQKIVTKTNEERLNIPHFGDFLQEDICMSKP